MGSVAYSEQSASYNYTGDDETIALSSLSNNGNASSNFSQLEDQFNKLQNDILIQGRQVEKFIQQHQKKHQNSESFKALQSLFCLFKTELQYNLSLRKALIQEKTENKGYKDMYNKSNDKIKSFLAQLNRVGGVDFRSMDHAEKFILSQIKSSKKFTEQKGALKNLHNENQQLKQSLKDMETHIEIIQAQNSLEIAELRSKKELAEENIKQLQSSLYFTSKAEGEAQFSAQQKQKQLDEINQDFRTRQDNFTREMTEKQVRLKELSDKYSILQLENARLKTELDEIKENRGEYEQKLRDTATSMTLISNKCQEALRETEKALEEKTLLCRQYKKERNTLAKALNDQKVIHNASLEQLDVLQSKVNRLESKYRRSVSQMNRYNNKDFQIDEMKRENSNLISENLRIQNQLKYYSEHTRNLENDNNTLTSTLKRLKQDVDNIRQQIRNRSEPQSTISNRSITNLIDAFIKLRDGLNLDKNWSPARVVNYILDNFHHTSRHIPEDPLDNESIVSRYSERSIVSGGASTLQAQIDSLQNEVESLRSEVNRYT